MPKNVLIVDDSSYMRALIKETVEQAGFRVIATAENGEQAIDLAFELKPDIITLDINLPDMLGIDILGLYARDGLSSKVIIISANGHESIIQEGLALGAKAYIVKPFKKEDLLLSLNKL